MCEHPDQRNPCRAHLVRLVLCLNPFLIPHGELRILDALCSTMYTQAIIPRKLAEQAPGIAISGFCWRRVTHPNPFSHMSCVCQSGADGYPHRADSNRFRILVRAGVYVERGFRSGAKRPKEGYGFLVNISCCAVVLWCTQEEVLCRVTVWTSV